MLSLFWISLATCGQWLLHGIAQFQSILKWRRNEENYLSDHRNVKIEGRQIYWRVWLTECVNFKFRGQTIIGVVCIPMYGIHCVCMCVCINYDYTLNIGLKLEVRVVPSGPKVLPQCIWFWTGYSGRRNLGICYLLGVIWGIIMGFIIQLLSMQSYTRD